MTLSVVWTKHIKDEKKKKEFEAALRHSTLALSRLLEILEERKQELDNASFKVSDFETPSWAYLQANRLGRLAEIEKTKQLLEFINNKE